jgi:hypothetical protein
MDIFLHSDQAMYKVKHSGKDSFQFYEIDGRTFPEAGEGVAGE